MVTRWERGSVGVAENHVTRLVLGIHLVWAASSVIQRCASVDSKTLQRGDGGSWSRLPWQSNHHIVKWTVGTFRDAASVHMR